ncbi:MAG TPA: hypothetical protein DER10_10225 [Elusimicrobia bacterium]|nr:hypothetical protein [Elusimicrobiota bacterium]
MKTNKALAYGLACLYYLGENNAGQWNPVEKISGFQSLSADYCAKVLRALVRAGFVESCGRGYRLKKHPGDISAWALMESFISDFNGAPKARHSRLPLNLHRTLCEATNQWLVGLTVQDIIEMTKKERPRESMRAKPKSRACSPL